MTESRSDILLEARNLVKHFPLRRSMRQALRGERPAVRAVDGVSFYVRRGEILGLVGESGCGKTTTGRLLLRLEEPTSGQIIFDGQDITQLSAPEMVRLRRRMQIVFQDPYDSMNPNLDIFSIVAEPLRIQGLARTREEMEARVARALADVELVPAEEFMYRYPKELSGGQRQRVAIARALLKDAPMIILDDSFSAVDADTESRILADLRQYAQGRTTIIVSHRVASVQHADQIIVLDDGRIVEQGTHEQLMQAGKLYARLAVQQMQADDRTGVKSR